MGTLADILNDELERYPGVKADQDYATRVVAESFLSGKIKSGMSAEAIAKAVKKPVDNVTKVNIEAAAEDVQVKPGAKKYHSFRNSRSGMANDALSPYNEELTRFINQKGDYIVDSFEKLKQIVYIAFDNPTNKATAYFGIINEKTINKIKSSISNLPKASQEILFKTGRDYSIATTLDSIRHIVDSKNLSRADVVDYLDRFADTIVEFDSVAFDYYTDSYKMITPGLLFKKKFDDGTLISYDLVSQKKRSVVLQSMYLSSVDYQKKKSVETLLMQDSLSHTPEAGVGQTSTNSISQPAASVKQKFSERNTDSNRILLANALETAAQNEIEANKLREYKEKIALIDAEQQKLSELNSQIREMSFSKGKRDTAKLKELRDEAAKTANRINTYDRQLLNLESTKVLKDVLERERNLAKKRQKPQNAEVLKDYRDRYEARLRVQRQKNAESRKKATEGRHKTVMKHKIKSVISELY